MDGTSTGLGSTTLSFRRFWSILRSSMRFSTRATSAADEKGYVAEGYRKRLPKANIGKSCVRFKRLSDLDEEVLRELIRDSAAAGWGM